MGLGSRLAFEHSRALNIYTPQIVSRCSSLAVALKQSFTRATHATVSGAFDTGSLPMVCHGQGLSVRANTPGRISGETDRLRFGNSDWSLQGQL
jgi:hypothetical protein